MCRNVGLKWHGGLKDDLVTFSDALGHPDASEDARRVALEKVDELSASLDKYTGVLKQALSCEGWADFRDDLAGKVSNEESIVTRLEATFTQINVEKAITKEVKTRFEQQDIPEALAMILSEDGKPFRSKVLRVLSGSSAYS
jgi:hypothetical protein